MANLPTQRKYDVGTGRTQMDVYTDIARAAIGQGMGFGFGDELEAAVRSMFTDKTYDETVKQIRADIDRFRETDPIKAYGAEIAGSMITGGGLARLGAQKLAGTALSGTQKAAAIGAGESAVYGAGAGEGVSGKLSGAIVSAPIGAATAGLGQKMMPALQKGAESMIKKPRSYPLTMGQAYGGKIGSVEQKISTPFLQESIREARARPVRQFTTETVNEAIKPLGKEVPPGMVGEEAVDFAMSSIQDAYQSVVPKAKFNNAPADAAIDKILKEAKDTGVFDDADLKVFRKDLSDAYSRKIRDGQMTGEMFKEAESEISALIRSYRTGGHRRQARVMSDIQQALRAELTKQNPDLPDLQAANKAFANMQTIQRVSDRAAARQGVFTPSALLKEEQKRRGRFSPEVERAREARDILGDTIADSGTAGREAVSRLLQSPVRGSIGLAGNVALASLYDYPSFGRFAAKGPARIAKSLAPASGRFLSESLMESGGGLLSEAQAGEMPIEDVVSIGGRNYAITDGGATYTLLGD